MKMTIDKGAEIMEETLTRGQKRRCSRWRWRVDREGGVIVLVMDDEFRDEASCKLRGMMGL